MVERQPASDPIDPIRKAVHRATRTYLDELKRQHALLLDYFVPAARRKGHPLEDFFTCQQQSLEVFIHALESGLERGMLITFEEWQHRMFDTQKLVFSMEKNGNLRRMTPDEVQRVFGNVEDKS